MCSNPLSLWKKYQETSCENGWYSRSDSQSAAPVSNLQKWEKSWRNESLNVAAGGGGQLRDKSPEHQLIRAVFIALLVSLPTELQVWRFQWRSWKLYELFHIYQVIKRLFSRHSSSVRSLRSPATPKQKVREVKDKEGLKADCTQFNMQTG